MSDLATPSTPSVRKTYKAYINGAFVRSESGRTYTVPTTTTSMEVPDASRKDTRDAIRAGRAAAQSWAARTPYLRAQIVYRLAEMLAPANDLTALAETVNLSAGNDHDHAAAIALHYAGWVDKIDQVLGSTNPVPAHSSSTGVVPLGLSAVYLPPTATLEEMVAHGCAALAAGNAVIMVVEGAAGLLACALAEKIATSDIPSGVWQILPTSRPEAVRTLAGATDVRALDVRAHKERRDLELLAAESITKIRLNHALPTDQAYRSLATIRWQVDYRTTVAPSAN